MVHSDTDQYQEFQDPVIRIGGTQEAMPPPVTGPISGAGKDGGPRVAVPRSISVNRSSPGWPRICGDTSIRQTMWTRC